MFINDDIRSSIREERLVFFIGSGFSLNYYPHWEGLVKLILKDLIDNSPSDKPKFEYLLHGLENRYIEIFEVLEKIKSHKSKAYRIIKDTFKFRNNKEELIKHKKLLQVSTKIITTNYDNLLEIASNHTIEPVLYTNDMGLSDLPEMDEYIFKIHGDYKEANNCVFFKDDYDKLYSKDGNALNEFKRIVTDSRIIFIGFSMSDPYISYLFEYIHKLYHNLKKPHYILTTGNEDFSNYGIQSIPLKNYDEINDFLDNLLIEKEKIIKDSPLVNISNVRNFRDLYPSEKTKIIVECLILFPEIFSNKGPDSFTDVSTYLLKNYGIINAPLRDMFYAGGYVEIVVNNKRYKVRMVYRRLYVYATHIQLVLKDNDVVNEWKKKLDNLATNVPEGIRASEIYEAGIEYKTNFNNLTETNRK